MTKPELVATVIDKIFDDLTQLDLMYKKGVPVKHILENTDIPVELIAAMTDIPVPEKDYIIPVQVIAEGYVKVKGVSAADALNTLHETELTDDNITIDLTKMTTELSDPTDKVIRVVNDANLVKAYTAAGKNFKGEILKSDIKPIEDKETYMLHILAKMFGVEIPDCFQFDPNCKCGCNCECEANTDTDANAE